MTAISPSTDTSNVEARRNALVLMLAAAFATAQQVIVVSFGGLAGSYLLGSDKSLATLPVSALTIGVAAGAIPAAMLMRRVGRRSGFVVGALVSMLGGLLSGLAIVVGSFVAFAFGVLLLGLAASFAQQYRFAAADSGTPEFRAKAISWVLIGGIAASIIGGQTLIFTRDWLAPIPFAGSFFAIIGLSFVALLILLNLTGAARLPPVVVEHQGGRSLREITRQPRFIVAVLCGVGSYGLMTLVMTAAPLAMVGCGISQSNVALGIQWHSLAMFTPSLITGSLIARFGKERIVAVGMALLLGCAAVGLAGVDLMNFWTALILLGVGWNFGFIGSTAMLTETYRPEEKNRAQGLNDFLVFGAAALGSLSSGGLFTTVGWSALNWLIFPVVAICGLALLFDLMRRRRSALA